MLISRLDQFIASSMGLCFGGRRKKGFGLAEALLAAGVITLAVYWSVKAMMGSAASSQGQKWQGRGGDLETQQMLYGNPNQPVNPAPAPQPAKPTPGPQTYAPAGGTPTNPMAVIPSGSTQPSAGYNSGQGPTNPMAVIPTAPSGSTGSCPPGNSGTCPSGGVPAGSGPAGVGASCN